MNRLRAIGWAVLALAACAPAFDWRSVSPAGLGITLAFPCRPLSQTRHINLGGKRLEMTMHVCTAEGITFALSSVDADDVRAANNLMAELSTSAMRNLSAERTAGVSVQVPGMTPHEQAMRYLLSGRFPNGEAVTEHMAVFARGSRLYQAIVVGTRPDAQAVQPFFDSIRLDS
jgi:hypothetical protein